MRSREPAALPIPARLKLSTVSRVASDTASAPRTGVIHLGLAEPAFTDDHHLASLGGPFSSRLAISRAGRTLVHDQWAARGCSGGVDGLVDDAHVDFQG